MNKIENYYTGLNDRIENIRFKYLSHSIHQKPFKITPK